MSSCAIEGCDAPLCPVCRFAGRSPIEIQRDLWLAWRWKYLDFCEELPPVKEPTVTHVKKDKSMLFGSSLASTERV